MKNRCFILAAACGLARVANAAPYSAQEFQRDTANYTQRMLDDIRTNNNRPASTYSSTTSNYSSGGWDKSYFAPAPRAKTYSERLLEDFNGKLARANADPSKPQAGVWNRDALAAFYVRYGLDYFQALRMADGDIQAAIRREAEADASARSSASAAQRQLGEARWQKYLDEQAAGKAAVEARAAKGDATAMGELAAYWDRTKSAAEKLPLYERAANAGDAMSLSWLYDRYRSGDHKDEAKARFWLDKMSAVGDERGALIISDEIMARPNPDRAAAIAILEKSFAQHASGKLAARLSSYYSNDAVTHPEGIKDAVRWAQTMLRMEGKDYYSFPLQVIDKIPVTPESATAIVEMLNTVANRMNDKSDTAGAAFRLARIYEGKADGWNGQIPRNLEKSESMYLHAAMHESEYVGPAAQAYFQRGEVAKAEQMFEDAKQKTGGFDSVAWFQAAQFWIERDDGKANGLKAIEFYLMLDKKNWDVADDIGDIYRLGKGIEKDEVKAVEWYRYGEKKNQIESVRRLAYCLFNGVGTDREEPKAIAILEAQSPKFFSQDSDKLVQRQVAYDALLYHFIQAVREYEDIPSAWHVQGWRFVELAEKGEPLAQDFVGYALINGFSKGEGDALAAGWRWIEKAKSSEPRAQVLWAVHLLGAADPKRAPREDRNIKWGGKPENRAEAVRLLRQAAEKEQRTAGLMLGYCYQYGWSVEKNEAEAIKWFEWGRKRGDINVLRPLFELQIESRDPKVVARAALAAAEAADRNEMWAQNVYGVLLFKGQGVKQNAPLALEYLDKAAAQGEWMSARSAAKIRMIGAPYVPAQGVSALKALESYSAKSSDGALKMAQLFAGETEMNSWFAPDFLKARVWLAKVPSLAAQEKDDAVKDGGTASPQYQGAEKNIAEARALEAKIAKAGEAAKAPGSIAKDLQLKPALKPSTVKTAAKKTGSSLKELQLKPVAKAPKTKPAP